MAWITENNCVGCPDGCRGCGRNHERIRICDECGDGLYKRFFVYEGKDYCPDCAYELFSEELEDTEIDDVFEMADELGADICEV